MSIKVFDKERELGLEDAIKAQSSLAFELPLVYQGDKVGKSRLTDQAIANLQAIAEKVEDDEHLYHTYSILVSTVWNKNDDIFAPEEVWTARSTPVNKPSNLEHDEDQIVGSDIETWPVNDEYELVELDESTAGLNDLPDPLHLLNHGVIYRQWQNPETSAKVEELIEQIEAGEKFVSMECFFKGFDYGILTPGGEQKIVARNAENAFLTKYLRAYGGDGVYQDHKIGRVLRNIAFSGKGYVDRPANPDSIIFKQDHLFSFASVKTDKSLFLEENGVATNNEKQHNSSEPNFSKEERIMSEILSDQNQRA